MLCRIFHTFRGIQVEIELLDTDLNLIPTPKKSDALAPQLSGAACFFGVPHFFAALQKKRGTLDFRAVYHFYGI